MSTNNSHPGWPLVDPGVACLCHACARRVSLHLGTCTSFPDGIPKNILFGADHHESLDGEPPFEVDPDGRRQFDAWLLAKAPAVVDAILERNLKKLH